MATEWKQAAGYPDYEVSVCGRVRRLTRGGRRYPVGYELSPKRHQKGYLVYGLKGGDILAHRLVALTWLGHPPSAEHEVAHNDGSRTNNHRMNLRWATPRDNQADRKLHGTFVHGENAYPAKLSNTATDEIRSRYADGGVKYAGGSVTMQMLADEYDVSIAQISRIVNHKQRTIGAERL